LEDQHPPDGEVVSSAPLSKSSSLPAISVGFAIAILVATWVAGARFTTMAQADSAAMVEIQDVADRQKKYIGTSGLLTLRLQEIDARLTALETKLALLQQQFDQAFRQNAP